MSNPLIIGSALIFALIFLILDAGSGENIKLWDGVELMLIGPQFNYEQCYGKEKKESLTKYLNISKPDDHIERSLFRTLSTFCDINRKYKSIIRNMSEPENTSYSVYWPFLKANEAKIEKFGCKEKMSYVGEDYEVFAYNVCREYTMMYGTVMGNLKDIEYLKIQYNTVGQLVHYSDLKSIDTSFIMEDSLKQTIENDDRKYDNDMPELNANYMPKYSNYDLHKKIVILVTNVDEKEILTYHKNTYITNVNQDAIKILEEHLDAKKLYEESENLDLSDIYLSKRSQLVKVLENTTSMLIPLQVDCDSNYKYDFKSSTSTYSVTPFEGIMGPVPNPEDIDNIDSFLDANKVNELKSIVPESNNLIWPVCLIKSSTSKIDLNVLDKVIMKLINKANAVPKDEEIDITAQKENVIYSLPTLELVENPLFVRPLVPVLRKENILPNDLFTLNLLFSNPDTPVIDFPSLPNFSSILKKAITHFYLLLDKMAQTINSNSVSNNSNEPVSKKLSKVFYSHAFFIPYSSINISNTYYPYVKNEKKCNDFALVLSAILKEKKEGNDVTYTYTPKFEIVQNYCEVDKSRYNVLNLCYNEPSLFYFLGTVNSPQNITFVDASFISRKDLDFFDNSINYLITSPLSDLSTFKLIPTNPLQPSVKPISPFIYFETNIIYPVGQFFPGLKCPSIIGMRFVHENIMRSISKGPPPITNFSKSLTHHIFSNTNIYRSVINSGKKHIIISDSSFIN